MAEEITPFDLAVAQRQAQLAHERYDADLDLLPQDVQAALYREAVLLEQEEYERAIGYV